MFPSVVAKAEKVQDGYTITVHVRQSENHSLLMKDDFVETLEQAKRETETIADKYGVPSDRIAFHEIGT